jgi:transcriptional regulator GlxA family with amidase domain
VHRCRRALLDPSLGSVSIAEIALCSGFSIPPHASRAFGASYGLAPGELRRQVARVSRR